LMKLLHPFMPFITEEIWQRISDRDNDDAMIVASWPELDTSKISKQDSALFAGIQNMISSIRNIRAEFNVGAKDEIDLMIQARDETTARQLHENEWIFRKLQNIGSFEVGTKIEKPTTSASSVVDGNELFIPLEGLIDLDKERQRIEDEIERLEGFLKSVNKKLDNKQFIENAPEEVVQREHNKKSDTETNLKKLKEILSELE